MNENNEIDAPKIKEEIIKDKKISDNNNKKKNKEEEEIEILNEEEEEISIEDEEYDKIKQIKDPNVKKLMELDFEKADKNEILKILLEDSLYSSEQIKENNLFNYVKQINKNQNNNYKNIESPIKNYLTGNYNNKNFYIYQNDIKIINNEKNRIINQSSQEKQNEIIKKLLPKQQKLKDDKIIKTTELLGENGTQRIDNFEKRNFTPLKIKKNDEKRNFNQFLQDEKNHLLKIKNKINNLKEQKDIKDKEDLILKPSIDKNSELLANKNKNNNEKVFERLYNLRNKTPNKILREEEKEKEEKEKNKKKRSKSSKKEIYIPSNPKVKITKKQIEKKYYLLDKNLNTNKIFYNHFIFHFRNTTNNYFNVLLYYNEPIEEENNKIDNNIKYNLNNINNNNIDLSINNINNENLDNTFENNIVDEYKVNNLVINKLSLPQLYELLFDLGICSKPIPDDNSENENPIQEQEKNLVIKLFTILKDEDDMVENDKLLKFLISVLGLNYYDLYREFRLTHKESEIDSLINESLISKDEKIDIMINTQNNENERKIDLKNKKENDYVSYDKQNKIIIPINKSKLIKKEFQPFLINYMTLKNKCNYKDNQHEEMYNFKPNIGQKSQELYEKYKEKVTLLNEYLNYENKKNNNNNLNCIERLILQDKRRLLENEKMREENLKKEMEECTFKPKINYYSSSKQFQTNRFEELIQRENDKNKNKKNKSKDEVDLEVNKDEYTFKPNIPIKNFKKNNYSNNSYNEKCNKILYERTKNGRMERLIKEAVHDRYELNDILKDYIKKNKENNFRERLEEYYQNNDNEYNNLENENNNVNNKINNINEKENINENKKINNNLNDNSIEIENKKDGIPLLIIDVNIRQGVKKKIYVYEGDTPEDLAEKFANEHNLENETKEKLQCLIHNHMLRLLTRIDEEK